MFRKFIYPSSGACDYSVELPHWSYCCGIFVVSVLQASACNTDTTPNQPHRNSNTYRTKNNTTNVVIQQNSRKFLVMDILMSEICWAHKKWNKIESGIELVFYSSKWILWFSYKHLMTKNETCLKSHVYNLLRSLILVPRSYFYHTCWDIHQFPQTKRMPINTPW